MSCLEQGVELLGDLRGPVQLFDSMSSCISSFRARLCAGAGNQNTSCELCNQNPSRFLHVLEIWACQKGTGFQSCDSSQEFHFFDFLADAPWEVSPPSVPGQWSARRLEGGEGVCLFGVCTANPNIYSWLLLACQIILTYFAFCKKTKQNVDASITTEKGVSV